MKTSCLSLLVAACSAACALPAAAQPVNDTCQTALPTGIGQTIVSLTGATADEGLSGPCSFFFLPLNAVWYQFTAPATGVARIQLRLVGGDFGAPALAVYDACGGAPLACSDDALSASVPNCELGVQVTAGQTILIAVADAYGLSLSDMELAISQPASTFPLASTSAGEIRPNVLTADGAEFPAEGVLWYRFSIQQTIAAPAYLDIETDQSVNPRLPAGEGLTLALYTNDGVLIASDEGDGDSPTEAALTFGAASPARANGLGPPLDGRDGATLAPGQYFLAIARRPAVVGAGPWEVTPGTASFPDALANIQFVYGDGTVTAPANDACAAATPIAEGSFPFTTVGATTDGPTDCGNFLFGAQRDIWFRYTPSATGRVSIDTIDLTNTNDIDTVISIHPACGVPAVRCANDNIWANTPNAGFELFGATRIDMPVTAGESMLIRISGYAGYTGARTLNIRLLPPACALAIPADAVPENEACGENTNPGCSPLDPAGIYQPLALGATVAGLAWGSDEGQTPGGIIRTGGGRDVDWFAVTLNQPARLAVTFASQYPVSIQVDSETSRCVFPPEALLTGDTATLNQPCNPTTLTTQQTLPAGTYYVGIANYTFAFNECGSGYNQYTLSVTPAGGAPTNCNLADVTGIGGPPATPDGLLTGDDFNAFIAAFAAGETLADLTGIGGPPSEPDGLITGDDFNAFIAAFAQGCP